jgi:hypothetical protein
VVAVPGQEDLIRPLGGADSIDAAELEAAQARISKVDQGKRRLRITANLVGLVDDGGAGTMAL